jgi:hypothetical protein
MKISGWDLSTGRERNWQALRWYAAGIVLYFVPAKRYTDEVEIGVDLVREEGAWRRCILRLSCEEALDLAKQLRETVVDAKGAAYLEEEDPESGELDLLPGWED